ncbi:MAG TPA: CDP-alcohol phosphatidyltransferase family protein [Gemmatimonadales bacterium]|jgi:CDP-diacylglycerol--glycerol-3-phosphate 3-phosphatidyltransferase
MASIYDLKPRFQALLRPLVGRLAAAGVTANQITVLALLLSLGTGFALAGSPGLRWPLLLVPPVLLLRMALNAVDGMLAREHGQKSRLGAVLNELGDVVSDAALYLPFALVPGLDASLVVLVVVLAIIGEMTGVVAVQIGAGRRYDGPMGKSDRAFVFGALGLMLGLGIPAGVWTSLVLAAVALLAVMTILNRTRRALATGSR